MVAVSTAFWHSLYFVERNVCRKVTRIFLERIVTEGFSCVRKYQISSGKISVI